MNVTKGLSSLYMLSGRGLDNGEEGAVLLASQVTHFPATSSITFKVATVCHGLEEKKIQAGAELCQAQFKLGYLNQL